MGLEALGARAGKPFKLVAGFRNRGDLDTRGVVARLTLQEGLKLAPFEEPSRYVGSVRTGELRQVEWWLVAEELGYYFARLDLSADNAPGVYKVALIEVRG